MGELLFNHLTVHVLAATGLTLRMRLRSHWLLSEWIATVLRPVTLATASHSISAPSLQSTNTTTGGWYSLLSWKATQKKTLEQGEMFLVFFTFYICMYRYFNNSAWRLSYHVYWFLNFDLCSKLQVKFTKIKNCLVQCKSLGTRGLFPNFWTDGHHTAVMALKPVKHTLWEKKLRNRAV